MVILGVKEEKLEFRFNRINILYVNRSLVLEELDISNI